MLETPGAGGGPTQGARRAAEAQRPIAAFDFDGTLTTRDSFSAFLRWRTTRAGWAAGLVRLLPALLRYLRDRDRGRLKAASVRVFLAGASREGLAAEAERFAQAMWDRLMRPDALEVWTAHGASGERRVIVTASPVEVVAPFARRLAADELIGSRLAWGHDGRIAGGLEGANCRGAEKVRRLNERFGPDVEVCDAYGDTSGDRELLAFARRGHMRRFKGRP